MPPIELKLHGNAWATGPALPQTPLGELASLPRPLAPLRALLLEERGVGGSGTLHFLGESYDRGSVCELCSQVQLITGCVVAPALC